MSLPTTDRTKLNNLSPNLVPQQIAVSALRLAVFQEIYTYLDNIITDLNAAQATGAVTTAKLADGGVTTLKLADNAVTGAKLLDAAVIASKLADGSVTTTKVGDAAVVTIKLADGAVVTAKIADLNVTSGKIADNAVISVKLADGAVLSAKIADGAVTSLKIADGGVTGAKIADNTITTQKLVDSIITAAKILDGSVTNAKLAPGSVTGDKVASGAINSQHMDAALLASAASLSTQAEFDKRGVNVQKYGAKGDGNLHKIKDVDPSITLSAVQALNPVATLDNSIDWYAIQKAINDNPSILVRGNFITDLPIWIKSSKKSIVGVFGDSIIKNVGVGTPCLIIGDKNGSTIEKFKIVDVDITGTIAVGTMSGNGIEVQNAANLSIQNCVISGHGDNGLYSGTQHKFYIGKFVNTRFEGNKNNGVKIQHYFAYQKNNVAFIGCRAQANGYNDQGQSMYSLGTATTTYGHGIEISGVAHFIGAGTDCEGNSGAGVYLGGASTEQLISGFNVSGCYFEPNKLADIYIDNGLVSVLDSIIGANYQGGDYIAGAQNGHLYIVNPQKISNSTILATTKYKLQGNRETRDIRSSSSLFIGGEFDTGNIFSIDKTLYPTIFSDGVKLTQAKNSQSSFMSDLDNVILFNSGLYEIQLDYYWNKVTPTSSILFGLLAKDYDFANITLSTVAANKTTAYANLIQPVSPSDTVLYFDNLTGWDAAAKTHIVFYDTVLSNGYTAGTEFSRNFLGASNINTINTANNTITLNSAIGKTIASGTQCALGNSGAGSLVYSKNVTTTAQLKSEKFLVDLRNLSYAKHIRYLSFYLALNGATDINDYLAIRRIRIKELDSTAPSGTTANRPVYTNSEIGKSYFDTSLGRPIWWSGTTWMEMGRFVAVPASATAAGSPGDWSADAGFLYTCHATNAWRRVAMAAW